MPGTSCRTAARLLTSVPVTFALLLTSILAAGCASSGNLKRIEDLPVLPEEVGRDVVKFEVREETAPPAGVGAAASAGASGVKQVSRRRRSKKDFQFPDRRPRVDPIEVGEKAVYDINYFGVNAGTFTLRVLPFKEIDGRKVYHVFGEARNSKVFGLFYSLHDTIETFIDYQSIAPHRFHVVLDETKQKRNSLELYDPGKGRSFFWNRWHHHKKGYVEIKDYFPMKPLSQDSLSALYFLQTVDLSGNAVVKFPVISEGRNWDATVSVVRREMLDTPMGRIPTIVLKPETDYRGILKKEGETHFWVTDDARHLLVRLEAKVKIGTVVGVLRSFEPGWPEQPEPPRETVKR